jgi:hypothetical protein
MAREPDDDALSWGDDGDPTYLDSSEADRAPRDTRDSVQASDEQADAASPTEVDADFAVVANRDEPQGLSSVMLLALGVLGGLYALYTVGWFTSATRTIAIPVGALDAVMATLREYLSVAAPALWFGATLLLTRGRKSSLRLLLLILGAIVLLPLPFALGT